MPPCLPNDTDGDGLTPLMLACKFNHYTLVRQLLSKVDAIKANRPLPSVDVQDVNRKTALMHAIDQDIVDEDLLRLLLTQKEFDINKQDKDGRTALILSSIRGNRFGTRAVQMILGYCADEVDVNVKDYV